jgi:phage-related baseplate assembly protein
MSTAPIDLSKLPPPEIVERIDYEEILFELKAKHVSLYPVEKQAEIAQALALESEPINITLQGVAYREFMLRQAFNDRARGMLLAFARGCNLEHLAALFEIERQTITPADPVNNIPAVMEDDDSLLERTQLAPQSFTCAGPSGMYVSIARNADGQVLDASAISPDPCHAVVTVLARDGNGTAQRGLLDTVEAALNPKTVRPLCDFVDVQSAKIKTYGVAAELVFFQGPDRSLSLQSAKTALAAYVASLRKLGQAVTLDGITAVLRVAGVQKVNLSSPTADIACTLQEATFCESINITDGGLYIPADGDYSGQA